MSAVIDVAARPDAISLKEKEWFYQASPWQLTWWRFRRHLLARLGLGVLAVLYVGALFAEVVAPYSPDQRFGEYTDAPPTHLYVLADGQPIGLFISPLTRGLDMKTFRTTYVEDVSKRSPIKFLARGEPYRLWGIIPMDLHLFTTDQTPLFLFGTDRLGRDLLSRIVYGARISLSIGFVGVALSFALGLVIGACSGYFGGVVDLVVQRVIEFILSLPTIPLWMALSAALPRDWPVVKTYFFITIILSLISWCTLARQVRGKLLSLREEDFVVAARLAGASEVRIMFVHLLPSFTSHLIVTLTLTIPGMILGETALSFLGLGMQPPAVSWGVLLQDAQNLVTIAQHPWQLIPCLFVIVTVLAFNFVGDGLRDAADPYAS